MSNCSGLFLDVTTSEQFAVQTDSVRVNFTFNNRLGTDATVKEIKVDAFDSVLNQSLEKNKNQFFSKILFVPASKPITQPYWLANKMEQGYFNVNDQQKIGQPDVDAAYIADIKLTIEGQDFNFTRAIKYKFTDPVKGEVYQPLTVVPAVTFGDIAPFYLKNNKDAEIDISLMGHTDVSYSDYGSSISTSAGDTVLRAFTYSLKKGDIIHLPFAVNSLQTKTYKLLADGDTHAGKILQSVQL